MIAPTAPSATTSYRPKSIYYTLNRNSTAFRHGEPSADEEDLRTTPRRKLAFEVDLVRYPHVAP